MVKHPILKDLLKGAKPENIISGFAHYNNFAQLRSNGRQKVGEVGGFLDAATGFGMHYALVSGYLAASIAIKKITILWKKKLYQSLEGSLSKETK